MNDAPAHHFDRTLSGSLRKACQMLSLLTAPSRQIAVPKLKLTKSTVEKLAPAGGEIIYWDEAIRGFGVRVKPNGTKSYVIQYRNRNTGRSKRKTIGHVGPLISFAQARSEAVRLLGEVVRGGDPVEDTRSARQAERMSELADQYLTHHAKPKKRTKSVANDISMLNAIILPRLGKKAIAEVTHRDIQALHNGLGATPYRANRTLALLSKMFELEASRARFPLRPCENSGHSGKKDESDRGPGLSHSPDLMRSFCHRRKQCRFRPATIWSCA